MRNVEKYEDGAYAEGSKQLKGLKEKDVESLKSFASGSASDHTSAFLSGPAGRDGGKIGSDVSAPELSLMQPKKSSMFQWQAPPQTRSTRRRKGSIRF